MLIVINDNITRSFIFVDKIWVLINPGNRDYCEKNFTWDFFLSPASERHAAGDDEVDHRHNGKDDEDDQSNMAEFDSQNFDEL